MPGRPYMTLKFFHVADYADPNDTKAVSIQGAYGPKILRINHSPVFRGATPVDGFDYGMQWATGNLAERTKSPRLRGDYDPRLYHRRLGLAVYWPPPEKDDDD